ncbi:HET-domain-containing protein [Xylaria sp. FL0933]|nr:HET-domain-containing protein [Xylaria sp. FL0933]
MYLLNVHTRQLQEFIGDRIPEYAILSHTWGDDEVLFQDLADPRHKEKLGYRKIEGCCQQAIRDGFDFVWIDTCCIDKRSSAELSEAINSMFRWYGEAKVCYVYLVDVLRGENPHKPHSAFLNSRWFTRGWTLQELIAPHNLKFFYSNWTVIFETTKESRGQILFDLYEPDSSEPDFSELDSFLDTIASITGIEDWHMYSLHTMDMTLKHVSVATKLSWVSRRSTTRTEDMAYCLLGLLDVNMPLLYGEGHRAFLRLQEEFLKQSFDSSILLWGFGMDRPDILNIGSYFSPNCLAPTPQLFQGFRNLTLRKSNGFSDTRPGEVWAVTPYGLRVELPVLQVDARSNAYLCVTDYTTLGPSFETFAIPLKYQGSGVYVMGPYSTPCLLNIKRITSGVKSTDRKPSTIYIDVDKEYYQREYYQQRASLFIPPLKTENVVFVDISSLIANGFILESIFPPAASVTGSWVYHSGVQSFALILHRKYRLALCIYVICQRYTQWYRRKQMKCEALMRFSPYETRRTATQAWILCRKDWETRLSYRPQLDWQKSVSTIDFGPPEQYRSVWTISSECKIGPAPLPYNGEAFQIKTIARITGGVRQADYNSTMASLAGSTLA